MYGNLGPTSPLTKNLGSLHLFTDLFQILNAYFWHFLISLVFINNLGDTGWRDVTMKIIVNNDNRCQSAGTDTP